VVLLTLSLTLSTFEVIMYKGFSAKHLMLYPEILIGISFLALLLMRIKKIIPHTWVSGFIISATIILFAASIMGFVDQVIYSNFIFTTLRIHPDILAQLGIQLSLYFLIS